MLELEPIPQFGGFRSIQKYVIKKSCVRYRVTMRLHIFKLRILTSITELKAKASQVHGALSPSFSYLDPNYITSKWTPKTFTTELGRGTDF